jgi:hypothetical protein
VSGIGAREGPFGDWNRSTMGATFFSAFDVPNASARLIAWLFQGLTPLIAMRG